jgi:hypothetical protein
VLPETWEILSWVAPRAPNLRAIVVECERNPLDQVRSMFAEVERRVAGSPFDRRRRGDTEASVSARPPLLGAPPSPPASAARPPALRAPPARQAVQRAVVRLLHVGRGGKDRPDDNSRTLLARIASEGALAPEELGWLRAVDPRAWRTDPWRAPRLLAALLEEYPGATRAYARDMLPFFDSARFDACLRDGGSLAAAFGAWLVEVGGPEVAAHARVEGAIAELRRVPDTTASTAGADTGRRVRSPRCRVLSGRLAVPTGDPPSAEAGTVAVGTLRETMLLLQRAPGQDGIVASELPEGLGAFLVGFDTPRPREDLLAALRALGADPGEDDEILRALEEDGIVEPA